MVCVAVARIARETATRADLANMLRYGKKMLVQWIVGLGKYTRKTLSYINHAIPAQPTEIKDISGRCELRSGRDDQRTFCGAGSAF